MSVFVVFLRRTLGEDATFIQKLLRENFVTAITLHACVSGLCSIGVRRSRRATPASCDCDINHTYLAVVYLNVVFGWQIAGSRFSIRSLGC